LLHGKIYYLAPVYIVFLAGGAVWWERKYLWRPGAWLKPAVLAPIIVSGIIAAPLAMPILPVATAVKYCAFFGVREVKVENVPLNSLPQLFGDMFGWQEQVQAMAHAVQSLAGPRAIALGAARLQLRRSRCDRLFGKRYGLRKAISGHNTYRRVGPRGASEMWSSR